MGIRMSGIISGMDTESIIKELMKAQSTKKTKIENKITKHEWKEEKWKELNSKIYALYTGTLSKARMQGSYLAKKVSSSDETKVTATASTSAVNGTHTVEVKRLAKAQYVTSAQMTGIKNDKGEEVVVSGNTKLTELGFKTAADKETVIHISAGEKEASLAITESTTVNDFLSACKSAGINANYDTAQKRFFLTAADSGVENAFKITTSTEADTGTKNAVRNELDYNELNYETRTKVDNALRIYKSAESTKEEKEEAFDTLSAIQTAVKASDWAKGWVGAYNGNAEDSALQPADAAVNAEAARRLSEAAAKAKEEYTNSLNGEAPNADDEKKAVDAAVSKAASEYASELKEAYDNGATANPFYEAKTALKGLVDAYANDNSANAAPIPENTLANLGLDEIDYTVNAAGDLVYKETAHASVVGAADSKIIYNGAELTGSSNTIIANGLTMNLVGETEGQTISINVSKDSQAVYDMVKNFIKEYNEVLGAMNDAYNAKSARGYEPLTDEEREAMTDDQVEKWENKIKDSLLRRDSTLGGLLTTMKSAMQTSVTYEGKSYALSSFGISMTDYTEYGKLHIYGDQDDASVAGKADKLMAAIEEDPDKVMNVISGIADKLYGELQEKMKSTTLSSTQTLYNDKQMSKELTTYKDELKKMESYLKDMEDRYYKQFTAMETAMAKLNSQANSLASLIGGSTQQ